MGEGGTRGAVVVVAGKEGPPIPAEDSGEGCRWDGEGECREGEPDAEESVDALKGWTGFILGRRMGRGPGEDGRSYVFLG
jgi:hypothetical protein